VKGTTPFLLACFSTLFLGIVTHADPYKVGDSFVGFAAPDQHGTNFTFQAGAARFIVFEVAGESGTSAQPSDPNWFDNHRALVLVDTSKLSAFKRRIAHSRMNSKPFRILVVENADSAARFPTQNGKFTVLLLDEKGAITDIKFASAGKELQDLLTSTKTP